MLLQQGESSFSRDRALYFEVCGGTVCCTKSPQSSVYYCHVCSLCFHGLIPDASVKSSGPGETNSRGIGMKQGCSSVFRLVVDVD